MKDLITLIICDSEKNIIDVVKTNEKGYKKSLENGILWFVHEETGRLIPYGDVSEGIKITGIKRKENWVEAFTAESLQGEKEIGSGTGFAAAVPDVVESLAATIKERAEKLPEGSYTTHLFKSGISKIRKKTGEEAIELILAENKDEVIYEAADLIYHMMVLFQAEGIEFSNVLGELKKRM